MKSPTVLLLFPVLGILLGCDQDRPKVGIPSADLAPTVQHAEMLKTLIKEAGTGDPEIIIKGCLLGFATNRRSKPGIFKEYETEKIEADRKAGLANDQWIREHFFEVSGVRELAVYDHAGASVEAIDGLKILRISFPNIETAPRDSEGRILKSRIAAISEKRVDPFAGDTRPDIDSFFDYDFILDETEFALGLKDRQPYEPQPRWIERIAFHSSGNKHYSQDTMHPGDLGLIRAVSTTSLYPYCQVFVGCPSSEYSQGSLRLIHSSGIELNRKLLKQEITSSLLSEYKLRKFEHSRGPLAFNEVGKNDLIAEFPMLLGAEGGNWNLTVTLTAAGQPDITITAPIEFMRSSVRLERAARACG